MKVKDVMTEVQAEITTERVKRIKLLLKEKQLELDAARKVLAKLESDMTALLDRDVDDFVFPHETGLLVGRGARVTVGGHEIVGMGAWSTCG